MIRLAYKLKEEEALRYFEMALSNLKEVRNPRNFAMGLVPVVCVGLMLATKTYTSLKVWIITVVLSLLWILLVCPMIYQTLCRRAAKKKLIENQAVLKKIEVEENNGLFIVNNEKKVPHHYLGYLDLLIVAFTDGTNLIVPERAFKKDEELMKTFIKDVMLYIDQAKSAENQ